MDTPPANSRTWHRLVPRDASGLAEIVLGVAGVDQQHAGSIDVAAAAFKGVAISCAWSTWLPQWRPDFRDLSRRAFEHIDKRLVKRLAAANRSQDRLYGPPFFIRNRTKL